MGIRQLSRVIADNAPRATSEHAIKEYFGRKVAIDASMSIYQFLIAVRTADSGQALTNAEGETTSHLMGMFYRTMRMLEQGLKPVYVFDGRPPEEKAKELAKRGERRQEAEKGQADAHEAGDQAAIEKFAKRTVKVTPKHNQECQQLLTLMGVPFIQAPGEAEAQCADLAKRGLVYGVGSEDMDTLTFGAPILLRHLTFSEARKMPIVEIHLSKVLEGMRLTMEEFVDLCILLGCDYCGTIKGVGPAKAVSLINEHRSIDKILVNNAVDKDKMDPDWPYSSARHLFHNPLVLTESDPQLAAMRWGPPADPEALISFLCTQHGFNEKRIRASVERLCKMSAVGTQKRMDDFFKVLPSTPNTADAKPKAKGEKRVGGMVKAGAKKLKKW